MAAMGGGRIVVAALMLAGCAHAAPPAVADAAPDAVPALMPGGAAATPPAGWLDYCRRHAADPGCGDPA